MPVISPRRSSTSGSSTFFRTTPSTSSSNSSATTSTSGLGGSSYSSRVDSYSKISPLTTSYSAFLNSYSPANYSPRSTTHRSYLSGGSTGFGTYRSTLPSQLDSTYSNNDTITSSRYGLKKPPIADTLRRGESKLNSNTSYEKKPPTGDSRNVSDSSSKRLSASLSSSSLALLAATSAADMYEKYSPAYYKPNCELSPSCSRSSLVDKNENSNNNNNTNNDDDTNSTNVTLERPRSRYSRLYSTDSDIVIPTSIQKNHSNNNIYNNLNNYSSNNSNISNNNSNSSNDKDAVDCLRNRSRSSSRRGTAKLLNSNSSSGIVNNLSQSNSNNDVPTATFTLRNNRLKSQQQDNGINNDEKQNTDQNGLDIGAVRKQLKQLQLEKNTKDVDVDNNTNVNGVTPSNDVDVSITATLKKDDSNQVNKQTNKQTNKTTARNKS